MKMFRKIKDSFSCVDSQKRNRGSGEGAGIGSAAAIISSVSGAIESDRVQLAQEREFGKDSGTTTMHHFGAKCSTTFLSSDDDDDASDESFDSTNTDNEISSDETPNWITIEDGKGGIKHIQTRRDTTEHQDNNDNNKDSIRYEDIRDNENRYIGDRRVIESSIPSYKGKRRKRKKPSVAEDEPSKEIPNAAKSHPYTITSLLRRELSGRSFFSMEPHHEHSHSKRIVSKKGTVHTERSHVSKRKRRYLSDFFNTMLDIKWRFVLSIFTLSFFLSWFGFAVLWWIIIYVRSDFEPENLPGNQSKNDYIPCVLGMHNFASVFLFSVETQHTIGYGTRQTTERCPEAIFMQSIQSVVGVMIQGKYVDAYHLKISNM